MEIYFSSMTLVILLRGFSNNFIFFFFFPGKYFRNNLQENFFIGMEKGLFFWEINSKCSTQKIFNHIEQTVSTYPFVMFFVIYFFEFHDEKL